MFLFYVYAQKVEQKEEALWIYDYLEDHQPEKCNFLSILRIFVNPTDAPGFEWVVEKYVSKAAKRTFSRFAIIVNQEFPCPPSQMTSSIAIGRRKARLLCLYFQSQGNTCHNINNTKNE